ncbi:hypothetical protein [Streptomyces johnsoniae]|uniref:Uncharacterized protein n=1 Tax=Streptomyces johnsoniae TaxID=3075532 RepID=A0ABU2S379_9ACTN|nr:hypothetical protein [Streptomyces sp. DSM 41886]MDT0443432.1 hypothetical protein [Streptomyces sp. DSM 41886]
MKRVYANSVIEVVDLDDVASGERAIEFCDPSNTDLCFAVVIPEGASWSEATVSLAPRCPEISVAFMLWAIDVAREIFEGK